MDRATQGENGLTKKKTKKPTGGSIYRPKYRKPDGAVVEQAVWWVKYYRNGVPIRESAKTDSWEEANRFLKRRNGEVVTGRLTGSGPERVRMRTVLEAVADDYKENRRKSLRDVQIRLEKHLIPALGEVRAADFGTWHIKQYIARRRSEEAHNSTINREFAIVSRGFHLALAGDPPVVSRVPHIPKLPEDNVREGFLDLDGFRRLLSELPVHLRPLFVVGYQTGVRSGELKKIQWPQEDWKASQIFDSRRTTKNGMRTPCRSTATLGAWLEMAKAERDAKFAACPWVFFDDSGKQIGTFRKAWASACRRAGVPGLLFHDLRRSAAMNMDRAGVPRRVIMQITGHKTEAMFLRYRIVNSRDLSDAADGMEDRLKQPSAAKVVGKVDHSSLN
jgi:integrase